MTDEYSKEVMMKPPRVRRHAFRRNLQLAMATLSEQIGTDQFERSAFQIEQVSVIIPDLSPAFNGYRIASIADIHLGQWITPARLDGVIGLINEQRPDLVAIIGDFFSYEVDRLSAEMAASLSKLSPKDLSVAVLGNHDHWVGEATVREGTATQRYRRPEQRRAYAASRRCGATHRGRR